jgi:hypothetical protein
MNDYENYLFDALEQVECWGLPEEDIAAAANAQAHLMAGCCSDLFYDGTQTEHSYRQ